MKNQLLLFLCFLGITISQSQTFNDGVLQYKVTDATNNYVSVRKIGSTCPTGDLTIPGTVNHSGKTYAITSFEEQAFRYCSDLTSVNIPNGVTSITSYAFYECYGLTSIDIPDSITSIKNQAFYSWHNLTSIDIPDGVETIGTSAFQNCTSLTTVVLPQNLTSIGLWSFHGCSGPTNITIPNGVISIREYAFRNCTNLKSVVVHWDTPLAIDANVFSNVAIENIPLTVPAGTEAAYRGAAVWQDFDLSALILSDFTMTSIRLYPNPASSFLKIDLNGSLVLKKATIYNNLGQLISEENETQISVSNYSKGLYFAEIETTQGKVTKKFWWSKLLKR